MRKRVVAHGRVQGVFFRDTTRRRAEEAGVAGWVANRPDGTVEAVFEGDAGEVLRLVEWMRDGPSGADVERLETHDEPAEELTGFQVR